jgi:predicted membrane protein
MTSNKKRLELFVFIAELAIVLPATSFYWFKRVIIDFKDFIIISSIIILTLHSIAGVIFGFSFYKQYPEDSEENILKNKVLRFLSMIVMFCLAGLFFWKLFLRYE